ncbi:MULTISPECIES: glycosyltransferase family 39 protein [Pseudomonas fluorescens group]|uniref:Glycosyltransferase RgtA/B/C/D-like domain-containing protein n=1 Tax=Pseudomonas fluorescens TaxID=294 RepID=A0A0D0TIU5_PSEFL|nr:MULTISPECIES: glycosyltransferase family 39 protein [Pseudomonas fluorescens group]AZE59553.1 putative membrane protein [Pseudomonas synxantha]KIR20710.1 hypothetical protein PFLU3_38550 [Pseudomonas fluorescens]
MNDFARDKIGCYAVWLLIIVMAAAVRFYAITEPYVWHDEAFSVWISSLSPEAIWFHTGRDVHPPLYYLVLHGWIELFGKTAFSIRTPSAIAGVATVALCVVMVRKWVSYRASIMAGVLLALFPMLVRFSQEARMYALETLFITGATFALACWVERSERYRYGVLYAVLMIAALYTHYYAILAALAHWLYLVILRLHPSIRAGYVTSLPWWCFNLMIVIAYVPWLFSLVDLLVNYSKLKATGATTWMYMGNTYTLPDTVWRFFMLKSDVAVFTPVYWVLPITLVLIAGCLLVVDRTQYKLATLLVLFSFVPMFVLFVVSLIMPAFYERYVMFSAVGLPLILAIGLVGMHREYRVVSAVLFVAVVCVELFGLKLNYSQKGQVGYSESIHEFRFPEVFDYISRHRQEGDIVVVGTGHYYFSGVFYNGGDSGLYLYWPSLNKNGSTRPSGYGAGTLMYDTWDDHTISDLDSMPSSVKRVWWLSVAPSEIHRIQYSGQWREVDARPAGKLDLRLYQAP